MSPKLNLSFYRVILISDLSNLDSFSVIAQFVSPCKYVTMTFSCLYIKYTTCHIRISCSHNLFPYRCITVLVIIDLDHSLFFVQYFDSLRDILTSLFNFSFACSSVVLSSGSSNSIGFAVMICRYFFFLALDRNFADHISHSSFFL